MMTSDTAMVWVHVHWLFAVMLVFGMIASLIWLNKFAAKKEFLNAITFLLIVGVIGVIVTAPVAFSGFKTAYGEMQSMMSGYDDK